MHKNNNKKIKTRVMIRTTLNAFVGACLWSVCARTLLLSYLFWCCCVQGDCDNTSLFCFEYMSAIMFGASIFGMLCGVAEDITTPNKQLYIYTQIMLLWFASSWMLNLYLLEQRHAYPTDPVLPMKEITNFSITPFQHLYQ